MELLFGLVVFEMLLNLLVRTYRRSFQWLITARDTCPDLDAKALSKFIKTSYDPELGWVRKPNTEGRDKLGNSFTTFSMDDNGCRNDTNRGTPPRIAVFGDSYAFCRQVYDNETWEHHLGQSLGIDVLNYGVGNYGVDQALLRMEREQIPDSVDVTVMAFVPETICRVLSYWKHYLEFGNTFAFKPRFVLNGDGLTLIPNAMRKSEDYQLYETHLARVASNDFFYEYKFRRLQFRLPYTLSFFRSPVRHCRLLFALMKRSLYRIVGIRKVEIEDLPFSEVMWFNTNQAYDLYRDADATALLRAIFVRFAEHSKKTGCKPLVMVMPQLTDLEMPNEKREDCARFYRELNLEVPTLDLTDHFSDDELKTMYTNDQYGGHFSSEGNRKVAKVVEQHISTSMKD